MERLGTHVKSNQTSSFECIAGIKTLVAGGCRNVKQYPEAKEQEGMLLVRIDSPIYFANVASIREALK